MADTLQVGDRTFVMGKFMATVRFVGETKFAEGEWFGVELDSENGKNSGSVQDVSYFECLPMRGMFVRRNSCEPEPAGGGKRTSKAGKRTSTAGKSRRKSSDAESPSSPTSPTSPTSPESAASPPAAQWSRRRSEQFSSSSAVINVDAQQELIETVRNCASEVSRLEEMVKNMSWTLDDAAIRETVCAAPAALFSGEAMPDMTVDIDALLNEATARLEEKLSDRLSSTLEEQLRDALAGNQGNQGEQPLGITD